MPAARAAARIVVPSAHSRRRPSIVRHSMMLGSTTSSATRVPVGTVTKPRYTATSAGRERRLSHSVRNFAQCRAAVRRCAWPRLRDSGRLMTAGHGKEVAYELMAANAAGRRGRSRALQPQTPAETGSAGCGRTRMNAFPHCYSVIATAHAEGDVTLTADRLSALRSASPAEFGGPGDQWSPETFLVGAVADCFILAFRAVATASKLPWTSLRCVAVGTLDRVDRVTQFTNVTLR